MAGLGGLSSGSATAGASALRGYGGLASGLDRDSLIESMTAATTAKITKQQQAKQKIAWQQDAMRGITNKLYSFSQNFTSYTSSKNLLSGKLFSSSSITTKGANGGYISVTGNSTIADSMSILGVKQLASDAAVKFKNSASNQSLLSGDIDVDFNTEKDFSTVAGTSITIKYGSKSYLVSLPENDPEYKYSTEDEIGMSLAKAFSKVSVGDGKTLQDVIGVSISDSKLTLKNIDPAGNEVKVVGYSDSVLENLGFDALFNGSTMEITEAGVQGDDPIKVTERKSIADQIGGKQIAFTYNGKSEWITLASVGDLKNDANGLDTLRNDLQNKLDKAFGKGRITIEGNGGTGATTGKLVFKTTKPKEDGTGVEEDLSSVFSVDAGSRGLLVDGALSGLNAGDSNRLNMDTGFMKSGLRTIGSNTFPADGKLIINGVEIKLAEDAPITENTSLREIIDAVNASDAGVKINYQKDADRFTITSTSQGASGEVNLDGDIAGLLFGKADVTDADGNVITAGDYSVSAGKDAIIAVKYEGAQEATIITRSSNTFNLNGLSITAKGVFGYDGTGTLDPTTEAVTFDVKMDTEPATKAVKEMVEAYNELVKLINDEASTKPNRSYAPLTSEQEAEMSESQIEAWNEKAKAGLLFNDSDIRGLASGLRTMISNNSQALSKMGVTVSSDYGENGKLVFDEAAFKSALSTDPNSVIDAFTREEKLNDKGEVEDAGGLMVRMQKVMNKYGSMTGSVKGVLVERAGSVFAPTSILTNSMQKQIDGIDKDLDRLADKLKIEQDRYISQFTALETLISQMNSQSSWLSSSLG